MGRVVPAAKESAHELVKPIYAQMEKKMGKIPNIFLSMGNSPQALQAYLALNEQVEKTSFSQAFKEQLALVIAESNKCTYCLSAHSVIAKGAGLQEHEILNARQAKASTKKDEALLLFAKSVIEKKGAVSDKEVQQIKALGVSDKELCELMLVIALNMYTNYFNNVINPEIDFPLAPKI